MLGHGDGTQSLGAGLGQQHLDRRGAVIGMVGVHVQIDVDQRPVCDQSCGGEVARPSVVSPGGERPVDPLDLVSCVREAQPLTCLRGLAAAARVPQSRVAREPRQPSGEGLGIPGAVLPDRARRRTRSSA